MDPPKLQPSEQEKERLQKLVKTLKILYKDKNVYRRPRGRPRKVQVHSEVKPSQIRRFRLTPQQLMELVNPEQSKKKREFMEEYKKLLLEKLMNNEKLTNRRFNRNIRDLTLFYQRLPNELEQELQLWPILPSYLYDKPIPARLDLRLYFQEINEKTRHYRYTYFVDEEEFLKFREEAIAKDVDVARYIIDEIVKTIAQETRFDILKTERLKLGYFCRLNLRYIYKKGENLIELYSSSLSHKRPEHFIKMLSEIEDVFKMLGDEVLTRIYNMFGSKKVKDPLPKKMGRFLTKELSNIC
jgi:hypothetical protein